MKISTIFHSREFPWHEKLDSLSSWDSPETLVILFGASSFLADSSALDNLKKNFIESKIIGCSTAGEIFGQTIHDGTLCGAILRFEKSRVRLAFAAVNDHSRSFDAGKKIADQLKGEGLRGIFLLSDGLSVNGSRLIAGINSILPSSVAVTGGLAGDMSRFSKTWVLKDCGPVSNYVSAVGFYGESVSIGHGSKGGWDIFGPERRVTRSSENQLFEIDGKPALQLYKDYLGERASELPASALLFPLALRNAEGESKQIVRTILKVNENDQSMIFAGDIPEGSLVQLMRANFDRLIDGASEASRISRIDGSGKEILSIAISCVGRRLILGERAEEELEAAMEFMPENTEQIGFYSYGEISPFSNGYCDLHNQTMTLTTISED